MEKIKNDHHWRVRHVQRGLSLMWKPSQSSHPRRPTDWTRYSNPHLALKSTAKYFPSLPGCPSVPMKKGARLRVRTIFCLILKIKFRCALRGARINVHRAGNSRLGFPAHSYSSPATRCQMDRSAASSSARPGCACRLFHVSHGGLQKPHNRIRTPSKRRGVIQELNGLYNQDVRVNVYSGRLGGRNSPEMMSPACLKKKNPFITRRPCPQERKSVA